MDYRECVDYIEHIPRFKTGGSDRGKSGNDNLAGVLLLLGNPELKKKTVHIAGTNGKGSTSRFTRCILEEYGYRVGVFTSPHLVKINERISTSQGDISDEDFLECFNEVYAAIERHMSRGGSNLSFFEYLFAIAAVYFGKSDIDYVIYETGLGGRLDATNLIKPVATAITSIGLDHTQYLGDTIEKIAGEKAGIIKPGVPVVYNTGSSVADHVIENVAKDLMVSAINVAKTDYIINEITDSGIDFSVHSSYYKYCNVIIPNCRAPYQVDNFLTAVCLCEAFMGALSEERLKRAVTTFKWPGRMEEIQKNVYLDGAHNPDAMSRFVEACRGISGGKESLLLFAVSRHIVK